MFGISREDFEVLCSVEAQGEIAENIEKEPTALALKGVSAVVCNQIKFLRKCKVKLPHYYTSHCIIPPISYEQASSALSVVVKKECGERFLDLTCGLGVDTYHYSKQFKEVVTIEREDLIADIAIENFKRLGADNITVICSSCEDFLESYSGPAFDLVYIDPARRDSNRRIFLIEDCSPDVVKLLPLIERLSKKLVIKLSPLFDIKEAFRIFGQGVTLRAVSVGGECKELCVEINFNSCSATKIVASAVDKNGNINEVEFDQSPHERLINTELNINKYRYVSILDVAIRKMRCSERYHANFFTHLSPLYDNDVALWTTYPEGIMGRVYEIEKVMEYKPKLFREMGIKSATIIIHNFPLSQEELRKRLSLKSGSESTLVFTTIKNKQYIFKIL